VTRTTRDWRNQPFPRSNPIHMRFGFYGPAFDNPGFCGRHA
jgi:hypothetical protein